MTTGTLPGGRYAVVTHTGPYHELHEANMALDTLGARARARRFAGREAGDRFVDATRLEISQGPGRGPSSGHPVTEVAFRLADWERSIAKKSPLGARPAARRSS